MSGNVNISAKYASFINHCISASILRPLFKPKLFNLSLVSSL